MTRKAARSTSATIALLFVLVGMVAGSAAAEDWPTYLHDPGRSSTSGETVLSSSNAAQLTKLWAFKTGGGVAASPTVVGGIVYVGSWDGYEYALDAATGVLKWKTFLGVTNGAANCPFPQSAGVTSSASVQNGVVYVGGGDSYWYALDASTGAVLWRLFTGDNSVAGGHYNWASPLIYNGSAYVGIASLGDCPLVQGELLRVDLSTHQVVATFKAVPDGQVGGGVWTSPAVDPTTNTIYVTTGTQTSANQPYAQAFVAVDATTLAVKGSWQVPLADQVSDGDWGTSPTLISGGLVVATNKNGIVYAFQRSSVTAGPVWQQRLATGGACPLCGDGSVSSAAFDGSQVYAAGSKTSIGNIAFPGSVSAFDPATGKVLWRQGEQGFVIPALAVVNGLVLAGVGSNFTVLSAASGKTLFSYATANSIYSPATVSGGRIFVGSQDDFVYAFGLPSSLPPPTNAVRVNAGGASYVDGQGNTWSADCCNSGGNVFSTTAAIAGTSAPALYQSEHWSAGPFSYTFSGLAVGSYQVTLKFAEIAGLGPGQRQFNVAINGTQVLSNLDVAAQAGQNTALDKNFTANVGSSGQLTVSFTPGAADNPIVSAIQVVQASSASLLFKSGAQTLIAGQASAAMQIGLQTIQQSSVAVSLSSSSQTGQFATSVGGPWSATLSVPIAAGQTASTGFYYRDTKVGSPILTANASGYTGATQTETVNAAALATISVAPSSATVTVGFTKGFSATGADQYGNPVDVSSAAWSTDVSGASVSPTTGSSTIFTANTTQTGSGSVTATIGTIKGAATVTVNSLVAPSNLTASLQGKHVSLSWSGSQAGVTYNLYRGTSPGGELSTPYATGLTGTSFNDMSISSGGTYYYYVTAVSPAGNESPHSNEASATAR
jgi:outer membrane protein assembly factor BamB